MASVATSWRRSATAYAAVSQVYLRVGLALRFEFIIGLVVTVLVTLVLLDVWTTVQANSPRVQESFTAQQMMSYIVIAQVVNLARLGHASRAVVSRAMRQISSGQIAIDLARPVDMQLLRYAEWSGLFAIDAVLVALPTWGLFRLLGLVEGPASIAQGMLFIASVALGWVVLAGIQYVTGAIVLRALHYDGFTRARVALQELFGGALIPLSVMPDQMRIAAEVLPFRTITSTPALIYLGRLEGADAAAAIGIQAAWAAAIVIGGRMLWNSLVSRLEIQGG